MALQSLFATEVYREDITSAKLVHDLGEAAHGLARDDRAGLAWSVAHGYPGYTSYASINDLHAQVPAFARLAKAVDRHALAFTKALHWNLRGTKPRCDTMWVNVMPEGGSHTSHLHANAVISGTFYVAVPEGAGPIVFEDPRLAMKMAAPPLKASAPRAAKTHVSEHPAAGTLLLWESWLRHEVPLNRAGGERISVSFNYCLG